MPSQSFHHSFAAMMALRRPALRGRGMVAATRRPARGMAVRTTVVGKNMVREQPKFDPVQLDKMVN